MSNGNSEVMTLLKSYTAGGTIVKNTFVKLDSNGEIVEGTAGADYKGVAMEDGVTGAGVSVALKNAGNIVQVRAGAAVTQGAQVAVGTNGKVVDSTSTDVEAGQADEGAGALDEFAIIHLTSGRVTA